MVLGGALIGIGGWFEEDDDEALNNVALFAGALTGMGGWDEDKDDDDGSVMLLKKDGFVANATLFLLRGCATSSVQVDAAAPSPLPLPPTESFSGVLGAIILAWNVETDTILVAGEVVNTIDASSNVPLSVPPRNPLAVLSPLAVLRDAVSCSAALDALVHARNAPQVSLLTRLDQHRLREDKVDGVALVVFVLSRSFTRRGFFMNANRFSTEIIGEYGTMLS